MRLRLKLQKFSAVIAVGAYMVLSLRPCSADAVFVSSVGPASLDLRGKSLSLGSLFFKVENAGEPNLVSQLAYVGAIKAGEALGLDSRINILFASAASGLTGGMMSSATGNNSPGLIFTSALKGFIKGTLTVGLDTLGKSLGLSPLVTGLVSAGAGMLVNGIITSTLSGTDLFTAMGKGVENLAQDFITLGAPTDNNPWSLASYNLRLQNFVQSIDQVGFLATLENYTASFLTGVGADAIYNAGYFALKQAIASVKKPDPALEDPTEKKLTPIAGTPEGFLAKDKTGKIYHVRQTGIDAVTGEPIYQPTELTAEEQAQIKTELSLSSNTSSDSSTTSPIPSLVLANREKLFHKGESFVLRDRVLDANGQEHTSTKVFQNGILLQYLDDELVGGEVSQTLIERYTNTRPGEFSVDQMQFQKASDGTMRWIYAGKEYFNFPLAPNAHIGSADIFGNSNLQSDNAYVNSLLYMANGVSNLAAFGVNLVSNVAAMPDMFLDWATKTTYPDRLMSSTGSPTPYDDMIVFGLGIAANTVKLARTFTKIDDVGHLPNVVVSSDNILQWHDPVTGKYVKAPSLVNGNHVYDFAVQDLAKLSKKDVKVLAGNPDEWIRVRHNTTQENLQKILQDGKITASTDGNLYLEAIDMEIKNGIVMQNIEWKGKQLGIDSSKAEVGIDFYVRRGDLTLADNLSGIQQKDLVIKLGEGNSIILDPQKLPETFRRTE